jgi:hypothetical protein
MESIWDRELSRQPTSAWPPLALSTNKAVFAMNPKVHVVRAAQPNPIACRPERVFHPNQQKGERFVEYS